MSALMTLAGCQALSITMARSMGSVSRQYWYTSCLGIEESRPPAYSISRKMMRIYTILLLV
jgi:hypothetical protein